MNWLLLLGAAILGWLAGGLLNWAADILPHQGSLPRPALLPRSASQLSHYFTLPWYFSRKGRCPDCGRQLNRRHPLAEVGLIILFVVVAMRLSHTPVSMAITWFYTWLLITVLVIDLEQRRVLNIMLAPAAVCVAMISLLPTRPDPLNMLLGGAVGLGVFLVLAIIGRGALGMGDVKLAGLIGMMTGYPGVIVALTIGTILGGIVAFFLLATRRAGRKSTIAYAPYLALGALVAIWIAQIN